MTTTAHEEITIRKHQERADAEEVDFSPSGLVIAGLAGIIGIMAVLYAAPAVGLPKIDVIGLAGQLFTREPRAAIIIGTLLWVGIGMLWAVVYVGLWTHGVGSASLRSGLLFGLIHGNVVMALFPVFIAMHPVKRGTPPGIGEGICLVIAHLVFGVVIALIYRQYLPPEQRA
jgi:hypothetical protein